MNYHGFSRKLPQNFKFPKNYHVEFSKNSQITTVR